MKIFKLLSTTLAVLCFSSDLLSDITFYGKINTSYESTDKKTLKQIQILKTMHQD